LSLSLGLVSQNGGSKGFAVGFLAVALILSWLVFSSITPMVIPTSGASSEQSTSSSGGVGSGLGGFGSGLGGLGLGGRGLGVNLSGSLPKLKVPQYNFTNKASNQSLPSLIFFQVPVVSFRIPMPTLHGGELNLSAPRLNAGGGGNGGSGGSSKSSGKNNVTRVHPVTLPNLQALIFVILALIVAIVAFALLRARGSVASSPSENRRESKAQQPAIKPKEVRIPSAEKSVSAAPLAEQLHLMGKPVPYAGWGGGRLLSLAVSSDLPLSWRVGDALPYVCVHGCVVQCLPSDSCLVNEKEIRFMKPGCYEIVAQLAEEKEVHRVWVVKSYSEDVISCFRANLLGAGIASQLTPREAALQLHKSGRIDDSSGGAKFWRALVVFEACKYGEVEPDRSTYEDFLRGLQKLKGALVMGCEVD